MAGIHTQSAPSSPPSPSGRALDVEIRALALPALVALAADPLVSMVDTVFVGRLGTVQLAALGVNAAIFSMAFVAFSFLASGTTPRIARAVGRGDREGAGRLAVEALLMAVLLGTAVLVGLQLLAGLLVGVMGAAGELREPTLAYLRIRALAGPAVLLITAGHGIFRGFHDTRTPLVVALGLNLVNLVLDPLLIFGLGWGIRGAAWATVAAQWTGALWFLALLLGRDRERMGIRPVLPRAAELVPFLRIGGELATRALTLIGTLTLSTAVATRVGTTAVAAHQVALQLWLFLALVVDALAVAGQAMVARYRGLGNRAAARASGNRLLGWGLVLGFGLSGLFLLLSPVLPRVFTTDPATLEAVRTTLPFIIWIQPLNALVFVWDGTFMGAEDFRFLAVQMILSAAAGAAVLLLVLPLGWGLPGIWWGIWTLMGVRALTLGFRYRSTP